MLRAKRNNRTASGFWIAEKTGERSSPTAKNQEIPDGAKSRGAASCRHPKVTATACRHQLDNPG